jgi:hypothetical protein
MCLNSANHLSSIKSFSPASDTLIEKLHWCLSRKTQFNFAPWSLLVYLLRWFLTLDAHWWSLPTQLYWSELCWWIVSRIVRILVRTLTYNLPALPESHRLSRLGAFYSKLWPETICTIRSWQGPVLLVNTIPYIMCMSLVSSNIGGFTKKATCGVSPLPYSLKLDTDSSRWCSSCPTALVRSSRLTSF